MLYKGSAYGRPANKITILPSLFAFRFHRTFDQCLQIFSLAFLANSIARKAFFLGDNVLNSQGMMLQVVLIIKSDNRNRIEYNDLPSIELFKTSE